MKHNKKSSILFLISQAITLFGSSVAQFAIIWYVTLKTSSGFWVSSMTVASYVPQLIISFFSGVWADRYPKKRLIVISDSVIAVATLALVLLLPKIGKDSGILIALLGISVIRSLATGVQTPAVNATIPQLVDQESLMRFNGINSTIQSLVQFAAPAVAGAVLSMGSFSQALLIDIATAVVGIGILGAVAIPLSEKTEKLSAFKDMKEGLTYALKETNIGGLLLTFGIFIFLCVPAGFLATLFVSRYYGDTYWYLTIVEVIGFIGMTGGGVLIGSWGGFKSRAKTLIVGMLAFGALAIGMGLVNDFTVYLVLMAVYGIALTMVQTASTTMLQENVQPQMQGRMFGLFNVMYSGFLPLGMVVFGPLSDVISMRALMVVSGILLIALAMTYMGLSNRKKPK